MKDTRLDKTLSQIDSILAQDSNKVEVNGEERPFALYHAQRRTYWLAQLVGAEASDALKIAVRAQHIRRWQIPRNTYPMDRVGYLKWRTDLKKFHAEETAVIMQEMGYEEEIIGRVKELISKKRLKQDPEVQTLEDALCLVFLETQFSEFAQKEADKIISIVQKTWKKMSAKGHQLALQLPLTATDLAIVEEALAGT